jgi:hypothetical protein
MSEPTGQDDTYSSGRPRTESNSSSMKTAEERSVSNILFNFMFTENMFLKKCSGKNMLTKQTVFCKNKGTYSI